MGVSGKPCILNAQPVFSELQGLAMPNTGSSRIHVANYDNPFNFLDLTLKRSYHRGIHTVYKDTSLIGIYRLQTTGIKDRITEQRCIYTV